MPESTGAWAVYPYKEAVAKRYRLKDKFDKPYLLYRKRGDKLLLPRALCPVGEVDRRVTGYEVDFDLKYPPRDEEQDRVIVEANRFIEKGQSGIIECPTGFGKTYCACAITALTRVPTLVVVTKEDLYDQWIEEAHKFLGLPYDKIGRIRQDTCTAIGKPFSVGMIHSLSIEGKYPPALQKNFGLVHFDEVHRLPADEFQKVAGLFFARWRVGWSATPDRPDNREIVFLGHIGPVRVVSESLPMVPTVYRYVSQFEVPKVVRPVGEDGKLAKIKLPHRHGRIMNVVVAMSKDKERNRLLAKLSSMAYKSGRRTILFLDTREHIETMHGLIMANGVKASDIAFYVGGIKKADKEKAKEAKFLLATYNFMKEGSDAPKFDAAILGTPKADVRQIGGRVLRYLPDKPDPIIIDVVDDDSQVLEDYAGARMKRYAEWGAKVVDVD